MSAEESNKHIIPFIRCARASGKLELNREVLDVIKRAHNPHIVLFIGRTRIGKSTTLNNLIIGCKDGKSFIPRYSIFKASDSTKSETKGCNVFGPIKLSELKTRNDYSDDESCDESGSEDADIFFVDSEGFDSLNETTKMVYPGILTLMQVCTSSVILTSNNPTVSDLKQLIAMRRLTDFMKSIRDFEIPNTILYAVSCNLPISKSLKVTRAKYEDHSNGIADNIRQSLSKFNLNADILMKLKIIAGGLHRNEEDVNQQDVGLIMYWESLKKIIACIDIDVEERGHQDGRNLVSLIEVLFSFLKRFDNITDLNKSGFKEQIEHVFTDVFDENVENAVSDIKQSINNDFVKCIKITEKKESAKTMVIDTIGKQKIEIFHHTIEEYYNAKINEVSNDIRDLALMMISDNVGKYRASLISDETINQLSSKIVDQIKKNQFMEDVDKSIFDEEHIRSSCEGKLTENETIYNYMNTHEKQTLDMCFSVMCGKIKELCNNECDKLPRWDDHVKKEMKVIKQEISQFYDQEMNKCVYFEDFNTKVMKPEQYAQTITKKMLQKHFNKGKTDQNRKKEIKDMILNECSSKYVSLNRGKLRPKPHKHDISYELNYEPIHIHHLEEPHQEERGFSDKVLDFFSQEGVQSLILDKAAPFIASMFNGDSSVQKQPPPMSHSDDDQIVTDVIRGKYGNGQRRKDLLRNAGYDPKSIQDKVNERLKK